MKVNLENLLPHELEDIISIAENILKELGLQKSTNKKYQLSKRKIECPNCKDSASIVKNGFKNGTQRYKCKKCKKYFSITTNSIVSHSSLTYEKLMQILEGLLSLKTINELAEETGITPREIYNIRIKILKVLGNVFENIKLGEIVQVDEKYFRISFKGTRKEKMPRKSRKNGFQDRTSGISKEQVCVVVAVDTNDNILAKVVGNGSASKKMIGKALKGKIIPGSILVTDSKSSYIKFAKENKLILKQIEANNYSVEDIYNLSELNEIMSELEIFFQRFRGLSTRHLQQYLNLFCYRKMLRYTVEYLKRKNEIYEFTITKESTIKNIDICKSEFPIDVKELYGKDFE